MGTSQNIHFKYFNRKILNAWDLGHVLTFRMLSVCVDSRIDHDAAYVN